MKQTIWIAHNAQLQTSPNSDAEQVPEMPEMTVDIGEAPRHPPKPLSAFIEYEKAVSLSNQPAVPD